MTFKFTKLGFYNALWTLIPIFPTWTLFPGVLAAMALEDSGVNCEASYRIVLWLSVFLIICSTTFFISKLRKIIIKEERGIKRNFRLFSFLIYMLVNIAGLILIVGTYWACHGDGQTILACFMSGPIASVAIILLGYLVDLRIARMSN